jgi:hypothetical protein
MDALQHYSMSQDQSVHILHNVVENIMKEVEHTVEHDVQSVAPTTVLDEKRFKSGGKYGSMSISVGTPPNTPTSPVPHSFPTLSMMKTMAPTLSSLIPTALSKSSMMTTPRQEPDSSGSNISQQSDPNDFIAIDNGWDDSIENYCNKNYELCHGYAWMNDQMANDCAWYANAMFFGNLVITAGLTLLSTIGVFYPAKGKDISIVTSVITVLLGIFITVQKQYKFPERATEYTTQSKKFAETKTAIERQLILPRYRRYEGAMYSDSLRDTYNILIDSQTAISNSVKERYKRKLIDDNLHDSVAIPVDTFEPIVINRVDVELKSRVRKRKTNVNDINEFIDQQNTNTNHAMTCVEDHS